MKLKFYIIPIVISCFCFTSYAQDFASIYGTITDKFKEPLEGANVYINETKKGTISSASGKFNLSAPSNNTLTLIVSYQTVAKKIIIEPLRPNERRKIDILLNVELNLPTTVISGQKGIEKPKIPMEKIDTKVLDVLPSTGEKVITVVKSLPGVSSNTELSSGYSVRGGNYDENLVYINDIEIYRPFLIRSGQQEGLPIINSDLVESIKFSAGGFEAKYGDKLSSVLDIKYRKPVENNAGFSLSLLGTSAFVEGRSKEVPFSYLIGARQRSNSYFLNSLDLEGEYNSNFTDFQSLLSYDLDDKWNLELFSYYGRNKYNLIPQTQVTDYGTSELVLRFTVYFDGQEITEYENFLNALNLTYNKKDSLKLKFSASGYNTKETEYFDVLGQYWLDQVDKDTESETYDSTTTNYGVGSFLNHARNTLNANIYNFQHKGEKHFKNADLLWGAKIQYEYIHDKLREWSLTDSSDYIIPVSTGEYLELDEFINSEIHLHSMRYSGYLQNTFKLSDSSQSFLTAGVRANYWDYNEEFIVTPRFQWVFEPKRKQQLRWLAQNPTDTTFHNKVQMKASAGMYYQPAFYRELRDRQGVLNPEIRAQKSYHLVLGSDVYFKMWDRMFKWTTEAYYKYLDDIIPYDVEDVRIRYYAKNNAKGYAMGLDMQIYGEFLPNLPSWANISIMSTKEDVEGDMTYYYEYDSLTDEEVKVYEELGYIPRPTDQRLRVAIFFQDFIPENPNSRVNLNFIYATPLPFGPPQFEHLRNQYRMRAYKRVDVGFSRLLISREENVGYKRKFAQHFESVWLSAEIFNMFGVRNVISYFWVKDYDNNYWGVPNYLTKRRFNVSLTAKF